MLRLASSRRGFTLAEMMVVISLLIIVGAVALVALEPLRERFQARKSAEQLADLLSSTRIGAKNEGRCRQVEILDSSGAPVGPQRPGAVLRVRRLTLTDCFGGEAASSDAEVVDLAPMPGSILVERLSHPEVVWLTNGRLRDDARAVFRVSAGESEVFVHAVAQGPVCIRDNASPEGCP